MRDDENIGSISKFYFGASAERRSYTQFTASRTRFSPPRTQLYALLAGRSFHAIFPRNIRTISLLAFPPLPVVTRSYPLSGPSV